MTLRPEQIGDKGQRYEIRFSTDESRETQVLGWADDAELAKRMANAWKLRPGTTDAWVFDRQADKPTTLYEATFLVPATASGMDGVKFEDNGHAAILYAPKEEQVTIGDGEFFVRLHSWSDTNDHHLFRSLMGNKVRIRIETVD
jgi:hypothetical protein